MTDENDITADLAAVDSATLTSAETTQAMRDVCAESIKGLRPDQTVYRLTADMIAMGYSVSDPKSEYTAVTVKELTTFLSQ